MQRLVSHAGGHEWRDGPDPANPLGKAAYRANSCICYSEKDDSSMEGNDW